MGDKNAKQERKEVFDRKGHRLIASERKPAERPKPQAPKPEKK